jgi:osmotically-inducible protein OsmY
MTSYEPLIRLGSALLSTGALFGCATYGACESDSCRHDATITSEVQDSFEKHAALEPPNLLTVHTIKSIVYLNGLVATELQRREAESVALETPGIAMVVNDIAVTER